MYTGANLQASFLAWCAVLGLAEETSQLPEATVSPIVRVGAEQGWPVDDGALWFSDGSLAFVQSKETLESSDRVDSDLAAVSDQLVRQHLFGRGRLSGEQPLGDNDRLLIVVGAGTGAPLRRDLAEAPKSARHTCGRRQRAFGRTRSTKPRITDHAYHAPH